MARNRFIIIEGKPYLWRDILELRREQAKIEVTQQPALFELKQDHRPAAVRKADDRYKEPGLF